MNHRRTDLMHAIAGGFQPFNSRNQKPLGVQAAEVAARVTPFPEFNPTARVNAEKPHTKWERRVI